jgi:hypothetical protein
MSISRRLPVLFGVVAPHCSLDVLKRRAVPKTFLKRGKVSIGCSQGEPSPRMTAIILQLFVSGPHA